MLVRELSEWIMSWGYWGIVAGLAAMLTVLFVCMEILYADARKSLTKLSDDAVSTGEQAPTIGRHAA
jgi:hypothetical protein